MFGLDEIMTDTFLTPIAMILLVLLGLPPLMYFYMRYIIYWVK